MLRLHLNTFLKAELLDAADTHVGKLWHGLPHPLVCQGGSPHQLLPHLVQQGCGDFAVAATPRNNFPFCNWLARIGLCMGQKPPEGPLRHC